MIDIIKEEYKNKLKGTFYESEYWKWIEQRMIMSGPLSGKDIESIKSYMYTQNYSMLTKNAVRVILHCLYFGGEING